MRLALQESIATKPAGKGHCMSPLTLLAEYLLTHVISLLYYDLSLEQQFCHRVNVRRCYTGNRTVQW
jgi:hypothetical protein